LQTRRHVSAGNGIISNASSILIGRPRHGAYGAAVARAARSRTAPPALYQYEIRQHGEEQHQPRASMKSKKIDIRKNKSIEKYQY